MNANRAAAPSPPPAAWESRRAPGRLALVQEFVNSHAYSGRIDHLADAVAARQWLRGHGVAGATVGPAELRKLKALREALRGALLAHAGHGTCPEELDAELGHCRVLLRAGPEPKLTGAREGSAGFRDGVAAAVTTAAADGTWVRLKACGNDECRVAFWDGSRNATGRFCSAAGCANRMRQRAYRARLTDARTETPPPGRRRR